MSFNSNTNITLPTNPYENENTSMEGSQEQNIPRGNQLQEEITLSLAPEVSQRCLEILQEFCTGKRDKPSTIIDVQKSIPHESDDDPVFRSAFRSYCRMLDS